MAVTLPILPVIILRTVKVKLPPGILKISTNFTNTYIQVK